MDVKIIIIISIFIIGIVLFFLRNTYFVKKYWMYFLILIPASIPIILKLITTKTTKKNKEDLNNQIRDIKEDLLEAQQKATIEVTAIRYKNADSLNELKIITKIPDKKERLKRLAEMMKL